MNRITDRSPRQLTTHPYMWREPPPVPERDSIFGDTYNGVPSPLVPVVHGYPTRYHGPNFTTPQPSWSYQGGTYTRAPFLGVEGMQRLSPSITGSLAADAVIGTLVGYFGAPSKSDALIYALAGGLAASFLGSVGLMGLLAVELYQAQKKGGLRQDLPHGGAT